MRRAFVFLDYDLLIRHFILSRSFREVEKRFDVTYVIHCDSTSPKTPVNVDVVSLSLGRVVRFEVPRRRMGSWDKLYSITALANQRWTGNYRYRRRLTADIRGWMRTLYYELLSLPAIFPVVRRRLLRDLGTFEPLQAFLERERPDIVLHPSVLAGYFVNELTQICPRLGIPLVLLMNSWDNPSTKAMSTGFPDRLVVWGPQTRRHAIDYMRMPAERVLEFGAPQFEVYREPITESDAELRRAFEVPADVPLILYAGVSKAIDETAHLMLLDQAIADGRIPPAHIIYRPHPWRGGLTTGEKNFFDVAFRHVTMDPNMAEYYRRVVARREQGFDMADYRVTARLMRIVSGVISPLSTMLLEAVMHGVPVIMFFPDSGRDVGANTVKLGMKLPHFAEFWGPEGISICTDQDRLAECCRVLLTQHQSDAVNEGLRRHARKFVITDGPSYAERVADLADELTQSPARRHDPSPRLAAAG